MFLHNQKLTDLDPLKKFDVLIPIGSTEQHGPYIPFGMDTYMTDDIVQAIDQKFPNILIIPTLPYSCSKEHEGFLGTIWLEEETMKKVLMDVCKSLQGLARSLILFTEHGGNLVLLDQFVAENRNQFLPIRLYHLKTGDEEVDKELAKRFAGPVDQHAGNSEISLMLSLKPELTNVPEVGSPKRPVSDPWETGRLKDKSVDGIADEHPQWLVEKSVGDLVRSSMKEAVLRDLNSLLGIRITE